MKLHATVQGNAVIFPVQVQPRASKSQILGISNGVLRIRVAAPPVGGKANEEAVRLLSKVLWVPRGRIALVRGQRSRHKAVQIVGITREELELSFQQAVDLTVGNPV
ncbi:MAG: YggU family protein [Acidobacteria bacterium]|nr:YggU family protein [Acidobacteriota bacterium]